jgi:Fur family peroxide stress response transcriptional regulator
LTNVINTDILIIIIIILFEIMYKKSKQRDAIVRVLRSTSTHPSAEWIYEQVKKEIPSIGLATVYRNLRILEESGEILEMHTLNNTSRFDGDTRTHYHFCCDLCGKIIDLDEPIDTTIETRIAKRTGLKVTRHHLELGGLCLECQRLELQADDRI